MVISFDSFFIHFKLKIFYCLLLFLCGFSNIDFYRQLAYLLVIYLIKENKREIIPRIFDNYSVESGHIILRISLPTFSIWCASYSFMYLSNASLPFF